MMLSTALMNTIDNTECVIFINTPNSIENIYDTVNNSTYSPWIYSELEATRLLRRRPISDYRIEYETKSIQESFSNELKIKYRCNLNHLCDLNDSDLKFLIFSVIYRYSFAYFSSCISLGRKMLIRPVPRKSKSNRHTCSSLPAFLLISSKN